MNYCAVCGSYNTELHHAVFRSQNKQLVNCKLNHIYLCPEHHRGTEGVHGKNGHKLDQRLKLQFQNRLEMLLLNDFLEIEEIQEVLEISAKKVQAILKTTTNLDGKYKREEVIRACMGGKLII